MGNNINIDDAKIDAIENDKKEPVNGKKKKFTYPKVKKRAYNECIKNRKINPCLKNNRFPKKKEF